ncbi:MAG TPA: hypothetical protein VM779_00590 [Thermoanaerobaculia bacterium]|nr:hypothetical protein [Thermoanaerobaculia bacterium]
MAGKGEQVASSIDAQVRDTVEKLVGEIRSSVEDIREAVDQQLKAVLQSVQADVNSLSFLPQIQKAISELEGSGAASAPAGSDATTLKRAVQTIEQGKSQVDVLNSLLEQALQFGSRAALLILRGETFSGWKGAGFSAHGGNDESIKRFNAAPGLIPQLDELLKQEHVIEWDGANLAGRLGVSAPARALLIPMVIKDKVSAAIYIDAVGAEKGKLDRNALELLVFMTGLLVDTLAIRKKIPSPTLTADAGAAPAAPRPAAAAPAQPRPAPAPAPPPVPQKSDATVAFNAAQMREMVGAAATGAQQQKATTAFAPPAAGGEDRPSTQFVPPAGMQRGASSAPASEETKRHDEARRFARLLVSEIKLYNEPKVDQGRKNRDLYERLKEDIDRSRQMYDERIAEDVRKSSNYFYDELVRVLADGNASLLGL